LLVDRGKLFPAVFTLDRYVDRSALLLRTPPTLPPSPTRAQARGSALEELDDDSVTKAAEFARLAGRGLGELTDENFDRLVRSPHRPYHSFVLFTARDAAYQCSLCK
jgi:hypothetical protein